MRFKDVFSIIGPAMTGPSSSHTAGAVRLGRIARQWMGKQPEKATMILYGSFAETYQGHGTDLALLSGLMDMATDDPRIADAEKWAEKCGIEYEFVTSAVPASHPNTVKFELTAGRESCSLMGASIGGGSVVVSHLNDFRVQVTGEFPALVLRHTDKSGVIASVTSIISESGVNIGFMQLDRKGREGEALTAMELDTVPCDDVLARLIQLPHILDLRVIDLKKGANQ